ncbi:hypothetical protein [Thermococcus sp.]
MKKAWGMLFVFVIIVMVSVSGCTQESEEEVYREKQEVGEITSTQTLEKTHETSIEEGSGWVLKQISSPEPESLKYKITEFSTEGDGVLVGNAIVVEGVVSGRIPPSSPNVPDFINADSALIVTEGGIYRLEYSTLDQDVKIEKLPRLSKVTDVMLLSEHAYAGIKDDSFYIYWPSSGVLLESSNVNSYALMNDENGITFALAKGKEILFLAFSYDAVDSAEKPQNVFQETIDCAINSIYPILDESTNNFNGLYVATSCGLFVRTSDGQFYNTREFEGKDVHIISNENGVIGGVVAYIPDDNLVYSIILRLSEGKYYITNPLKLDFTPKAASTTVNYLALINGNKLLIYRINDNNEYEKFAEIGLNFEPIDVQIHYDILENLQVGLVWKGGVIFIYGKPEDYAKTKAIYVGETLPASSEEGTTTTETQTSTSTQTGTSSILERFIQNPFTVKPIIKVDPFSNNIRGVAIKLNSNAQRLPIYPYPWGANRYAYGFIENLGFQIYPYDGRYQEGDRDTPEIDFDRLRWLPVEPKAVFVKSDNFDDVIMAGTDGKVYILLGSESGSVKVGDREPNAFRTIIPIEINADGVGAGFTKYKPHNYLYYFWSGRSLYMVGIDDDTHYKLWSGELKDYKPEIEKYDLPRKILEVQQLNNKGILLVRLDNGMLYLLFPNFHEKFPGKVVEVRDGVAKFQADSSEYSDRFIVYRAGYLELYQLEDDTPKLEGKIQLDVPITALYMDGRNVFIAGQGFVRIYSIEYNWDTKQYEFVRKVQYQIDVTPIQIFSRTFSIDDGTYYHSIRFWTGDNTYYYLEVKGEVKS